jgi:3-oxoadipate enol-lactonase
MAFDEMAYIDKGSGLPLVLLHAFPLNRCMWNPQLEYLSNSFRVIAPDYHGFGDSPVAKIPFSLETLADDIADLLSSLGVSNNIALLGISMGGYVAFEFARKFQRRLRALVLAATHPALDSDAGRQSRYAMAEKVRNEGAAGLAEGMIPRLLGKTTLVTQPEMSMKIRNLILRNQPEGIAHGSLAMATRRDSTDLLDLIHVPTLILSGAEDSIIPAIPPAVMHRKIAGSAWISIDQCGHLMNLERPDMFNNAVLEFLRSH